MDRIPIKLPTPSSTWDRTLPEHVIFLSTLDTDNVRIMEAFLTFLDKRMEKHTLDSDREATQLLEDVKKDEDKKGLYENLTKIIVCAPENSVALCEALKMRGSWNISNSRYGDAINDYEMLRSVKSPHTLRFLCEIYGHMTICFKHMRQFDSSRKHSQLFKEYRVSLQKHIKECDINSSDNETLQPSFSNDISTKGLSTSCYSGNDGTAANEMIPSERIIFREQIIDPEFGTPLVQCELCMRKIYQLYTCLTCRYKTYCSSKCMENDKLMHDFECAGYKNLTLFLLDATSLFRIFMRVSMLLDRTIFTDTSYHKLTTCAELFEKLERYQIPVNFEGIEYIRLLNIKPDYSKLSETQYATLVVTAFRLTIFIEKQPNIMNLYKKLRVQKRSLFGALLMRIQCHMYLDRLYFEYPVVLYNSDSCIMFKDFKKLLVPLGSEYIVSPAWYSDTKDSYIQSLEQLMQSQMDKDLKHAPAFKQTELATFKAKLIEEYFSEPDTTAPEDDVINSRLAEMNDLKQYDFIKTCALQFHENFYDHFSKLRMHNSISQIVYVYCRAALKFRYSTEPNTNLSVRENGVIEGKTICDVAPGKELLISNKTILLERAMCNVISEDTQNERLGIFCEGCGWTVITPKNKICGQCGLTYDDLSAKYKEELAKIAFNRQLYCVDQTTGNDEDVFLFNFGAYQHARTYFVPSNEVCIAAERSLAAQSFKNFLLYNNHFSYLIEPKFLNNYDECRIWFTLYRKVLLSLQAHMYTNLYRRKWLQNSYLLLLCDFGLYITRGQRRCLRAYESWDTECIHVMDNMRALLHWRKELLYAEAQSKASMLMERSWCKNFDIIPDLTDA